MKKTLSLVLISLLVCTLLVSCNNTGSGDITTAAPADNTTVFVPVATSAAPAETTKAPVATTAAPEVTTEAPQITRLEIGTADDLFALAAETAKGTSYENCTVVFTADIDLTGREWTPMDGSAFYEVTFDGQGHTISGMVINGADKQTNLGFIGSTLFGIFNFKDLTFSGCTINANGKECGIIIGTNNQTEMNFNNVKVFDSEIKGYMDYTTNKDNIAFRIAAFVGACWKAGSAVNIDNCEVNNFTASGFHNLAAFVGYDSVLNTTVKNSKVESMTLTFSYCLSPSYTIDMADKYVAVFYNYSKWPDTLGEALENKNTYANVKYIDQTTGNEYLPDVFRSNYPTT